MEKGKITRAKDDHSHSYRSNRTGCAGSTGLSSVPKVKGQATTSAAASAQSSVSRVPSVRRKLYKEQDSVSVGCQFSNTVLPLLLSPAHDANKT